MAEDSENLVNVLDPSSGDVGSVPSSQYETAITQGYQPASEEQAQAFVNHQKYGTLPQQAITGLEGAASSATFGLSTGAERLLGVSPEDIQGRQEENPIAHGLGQVAGLVAPTGAMGLIGKTARGAVAAAGLGAADAGLLSKVGSTAVQMGIETGLIQSGDEISKLLASKNLDDAQSIAESAIPNILGSTLVGGALGAGFGSIHPLWKSTVGSKLDGMLTAFKNKANGGVNIVSDATEDALNATGITPTPEIRAALSDSPDLQNRFLNLVQSQTPAGLEVKASENAFRQSAADVALNSVGKTAENLGSLEKLSKFDAGSNLQSSLVDSFEKKLEGPVSDFETLKEKAGPMPLEATQKEALANSISDLSQKEGYGKLFDSPAQKFIDRITKSIPAQETFQDLQNLQKNVLGEALDTDGLRRLGIYGKLKSIFRSAESSILDSSIPEQAAELKNQFAAARLGYQDFMSQADEVASRLKPGRYGSAQDFIRSLKDLEPEKFVDRMLGKNDTNWINYVQQNLPETAEKIKDWHLSTLVKQASNSARPGEVINAANLIKNMNKLSPELRNFIIPDAGNQAKLSGVESLLDQLNALPKNFSNTATTLDALHKSMPGTALGYASMLLGHSPLVGGLIAGTTRLVGREVPDAARLAYLRFLSSGAPIESEGFKTMIDFIDHAIKGENLAGKAAKNVFKAGAEVLPTTFVPDKKSTDKFDKQLMKLQENPEALMNVGGKLGHYMPEQQTAVAAMTAKNAQYLNSLRPSTAKQSPLDAEPTIPKPQLAAFHQALRIAEQPLTILQELKDNTLTPQSLSHLNTLYPKLYANLRQKVTSQMTDTLSDGGKIPYRLRQGLSLFLGQPLDSTMTPQGILSTQATFLPIMAPPQQGGKPHKVALNSFKQLSDLEQTPLNKRISSRGK